MRTTSTISPLRLFKGLFDQFKTWPSAATELIYPFIDVEYADSAADKARKIIITHHLPLVANARVRYFEGRARNVLVIELVPEEYMIDDEVPGEVMEPDWWNEPREIE